MLPRSVSDNTLRGVPLGMLRMNPEHLGPHSSDPSLLKDILLREEPEDEEEDEEDHDGGGEDDDGDEGDDDYSE